MTTKETWKPVTIGGLTGILMGAGTMYAIENVNTEELASGNNADEQLKVASVDDSLNFRDAFEAARAEVGPGGVFRWHGNIYNTYTAEEWKAMSQQNQQLFAERVKPEVSPADIDAEEISKAEQPEKPQLAEEPSVRVEEEDPQLAQNRDVEKDEAPTTTTDDDVKSDDPDVRVVGSGQIEVGDGRYFTMEELDVNGQRVAIIDVDNDGVGDIAMADINQNGQPDDGEVIDLHTGESLTFTNDTAPTDDMPMMADNDQPVDDASDMLHVSI